MADDTSVSVDPMDDSQSNYKFLLELQSAMKRISQLETERQAFMATVRQLETELEDARRRADDAEDRWRRKAESESARIEKQLQERMEREKASEWHARAELQEQLEKERKEVRQLRAYLADAIRREKEGQSTPSPSAEREEQLKRRIESLNDELTAATRKNELLSIRLDSMKEMLALQDAEISRARADGDAANIEPRVVQAWRNKVLELLIERKTDELSHVKRLQEEQQRIAELRKELSETKSALEMAKQMELDRRAEVELQASAAKLAQAALEKVEQREQRLSRDLEEHRTALARLASFIHTNQSDGIRFDEAMASAELKLQAYAERLDFALGRMKLLRGLLEHKEQRHKNEVAKLREESGLRGSVSTMSTTKPLSSTIGAVGIDRDDNSSERDTQQQMRHAMSHLRREIERLTTERDQLLRKAQEEAERFEERVEQVRHEFAADLRARADEIRRLQDELAEASQTIARLQAQLEASEASSSAKHAELMVYKKEIKALRAELEAQRTTSASRQELDSVQNEYAQLKKEHSKTVVALRAMERELVRLRERNDSEDKAAIARLEGEVASREEQLRQLRKERNSLLSTIRQQERLLARLGAKNVVSVGVDMKPEGDIAPHTSADESATPREQEISVRSESHSSNIAIDKNAARESTGKSQLQRLFNASSEAVEDNEVCSSPPIRDKGRSVRRTATIVPIDQGGIAHAPDADSSAAMRLQGDTSTSAKISKNIFNAPTAAKEQFPLPRPSSLGSSVKAVLNSQQRLPTLPPSPRTASKSDIHAVSMRIADTTKPTAESSSKRAASRHHSILHMMDHLQSSGRTVGMHDEGVILPLEHLH